MTPDWHHIDRLDWRWIGDGLVMDWRWIGSLAWDRQIGMVLVRYWWISGGLADWSRIDVQWGIGLTLCCDIGESWQIGQGLALDWRIGNRLADCIMICTGLTDQSRIGIGLVNRSWVGCDWIYLAGGGEVVLRRDTSSGPYSKLVPRLVGQLSSD